MTEEDLLAAMQEVARAEIALAQAKMKRYVDAQAILIRRQIRYGFSDENPYHASDADLTEAKRWKDEAEEVLLGHN